MSRKQAQENSYWLSKSVQLTNTINIFEGLDNINARVKKTISLFLTTIPFLLR
jgi:hypothetical protein